MTSRAALAILSGFAFMLLVERVLISHNHTHPDSDTMHMKPILIPSQAVGRDDLNLQDVCPDPERAFGSAHEGYEHNHTFFNESVKAFPITLGLVFHSLADGLALGASSFHRDIDDNGQKFDLSLVVFMSLVIHKGRSLVT